MDIKLFFFSLILFPLSAYPQRHTQQTMTNVGMGWAQNSVNTVVLGKRQQGTDEWELEVTSYKGNNTDAHNAISIMVDGDGYLHMSWDHHNNPLRYCKSTEPGALVMSEKLPMTGQKEQQVTYPEFYSFPNGDLLFLYRDGGSGNGNLMLNHYHTKEKKWSRLQDGLINGEGKRRFFADDYLIGDLYCKLYAQYKDRTANWAMCKR
ncbi:BNR repeat-containing protein [Parapedobacter tibetensis]|uniref:BNR repeat-containing protein n=1 Tax=Parapedobacter tibetensis TaxID=2972951 RepID=UPI00214D6279|nr:BNR repeat-containing protein [Parapedobacter tibetensis]